MTTKQTITARRAEILELVLTAPKGLTLRQIAQRFDCKTSSMRESLHKLRDLGLLGTSADGGRAVVWIAKTTADEIRARSRSERAAKLWAMRRNRKRELLKYDRHIETGEPIQRTVAADACERVVIRGPASVFDLAVFA